MKNISGLRLREDASVKRSATTARRSDATAGFLCGAVFGFALMLVLVGIGSNENVTIIGGAISAGLAFLGLQAFKARNR
jgi:hypothetical protein